MSKPDNRDVNVESGRLVEGGWQKPTTRPAGQRERTLGLLRGEPVVVAKIDGHVGHRG